MAGIVCILEYLVNRNSRKKNKSTYSVDEDRIFHTVNQERDMNEVIPLWIDSIYSLN